MKYDDSEEEQRGRTTLHRIVRTSATQQKNFVVGCMPLAEAISERLREQ